MESGDFDRALADTHLAQRQGAAIHLCASVRGSIHIRQGDFHAAVEEFTTAIEANPRCHKNYEQRAYAWFMLGQRAKGNEDRLLAKQWAPQKSSDDSASDSANERNKENRDGDDEDFWLPKDPLGVRVNGRDSPNRATPATGSGC
jgi:tetratricopeptide (TPR) repeat protein